MDNIAIYLLWAALGLILIVVEMMTATFILLSFGIAAFIVALFTFLGLEGKPAQVAVFAVFGLIILALIRKRKLKNPGGNTFNADQNRSFVLDHHLQTAILPGTEGTVNYQGAPWTAVNVGSTSLHAGQKVIVTKTQGIKIYIKASDEA